MRESSPSGSGNWGFQVHTIISWVEKLCSFPSISTPLTSVFSCPFQSPVLYSHFTLLLSLALHLFLQPLGLFLPQTPVLPGSECQWIKLFSFYEYAYIKPKIFSEWNCKFDLQEICSYSCQWVEALLNYTKGKLVVCSQKVSCPLGEQNYFFRLLMLFGKWLFILQTTIQSWIFTFFQNT